MTNNLLSRTFIRHLSASRPTTTTPASLNRFREAVIQHLSSPSISMDEPGVRDTLLQFIRAGDHSLSASLLTTIVHKQLPWIDADGKLTCMWYSSMDPTESGQMGQVMGMLESGLRVPGCTDGMINAARWIMRQSFPVILDLADAELMDRWLALPKLRRALQDSRIGSEQLELAITRVYLKRHRWDRIAQLIMQLGHPASQSLYSELFTTCLSNATFYHDRGYQSAFVGKAAYRHPGYADLQGRLEGLMEAGVRLGPNAWTALEEVMMEHQAPVSFISFLEGLAPTKSIVDEPTESVQAEEEAAL